MKQFQPIYLLIVKFTLINSHYWPTGYNSLSSDHTWSWTPSTHHHTPQPVLSPARPFSISRNSFYSSKTNKWPVQGDIFPSYATRCGSCIGQPLSQVCGSDGKTYRNSCELQYTSCKKYWDLREVSKGACRQDCPGVDLGMYTGWGLSRASNNGYCHQDFFRCCKAARRVGLGYGQTKSCCQQRANKCFSFVAEKPWRSGVVRYGK